MLPIDPSDPAASGLPVQWRVEAGSALRIYVNKSDMPVALPAGAAIILNSDVYPTYSGEYVIDSVIDFSVNKWAFLTTCIGTELKQEL